MGNERFHISHFMLHMVFNFYQSSHIFQRRTLVYTVCDSDNSSSKSFFKRTLKDSTSTFFTHAIKTQTGRDFKKCDYILTQIKRIQIHFSWQIHRCVWSCSHSFLLATSESCLFTLKLHRAVYVNIIWCHMSCSILLLALLTCALTLEGNMWLSSSYMLNYAH